MGLFTTANISSEVAFALVVVVVVVVEIALTKLGLDSRQVYLDRHSSPEVVGSFSDAESIKVLDLRTSCTEAIY
jgi:hypothetical protein